MEENDLWPHTACLEIPFLSKREAEVAYNTLVVDAEPKRSGVRKVLSVKENILNVQLSAKELRQLRVSCNSIFDHIILVIETIQRFGS